MTSSHPADVVGDLLWDGPDDGAAWPSAVTTAVGLGLLGAGLLFAGPAVERLDTAAVGTAVAALGTFNLYRTWEGSLEHPDGLRVATVLGLWVVAFSLHLDLHVVAVLTAASLAGGALVVAVNASDFARRYRRDPGRRDRARADGPGPRSAAVAVGGYIRARVATVLAGGRRVLFSEGLRLNLIAIVIGVIAGLGAVLFRITIYVFQEAFFGTSLNPGSVSFAAISVPNVFDGLGVLGDWRYLLIPAVGGLLVGLVIRATTTKVRGHGVPEVLEALMTENGKINPKISLYKTLASSIAIGSGASLGREGPIVQIGSAAGSYFGKFVDSRYTRTLVAAGAGGGIAATFNTPIAGVMFALEILLAEYYLQNVIVVVLSAVTATAVARSILGFTAAPGVHEFLVPVHYQLVNPALEFPLYILMGVVVAFVGAGVVKLLYATEHLFLHRLDLPGYVKPTIGGALLGLSVLVAATTLGADGHQSATWLFGVGYGTIHSGIAGELTLAILVTLALMKAVGFSLSVGSGSSGGVFSPSLFVGAMVGGAFGVVVNGVFAGVAGAGAYALVGTAGVFAAAASAPLTATLIIFELTGQYTIILPLLVVTVVGSEVAQFLLNGGTIYTEKLRDKGMTVQERRIGGLEDLTAKDVMTTNVDTIRTGTPIEDALGVFQRTSHRGLPIVDEDGHVAGILVRSDLESVLTIPGADESDGADLATNGGNLVVEAESEEREITPETPVETIGVTEVVTASPHTNLLTLVDRMVGADIGRVPIVASNGEIVGMVTRTDVIAAYDQAPHQDLQKIAANGTSAD
ncbi:MAG: chloride channel protein [Halobacteriaceae archaeon]